LLENFADELKYTVRNTMTGWMKIVLTVFGVSVMLVIAYFIISRKYSSLIGWLSRHY